MKTEQMEILRKGNVTQENFLDIMLESVSDIYTKGFLDVRIDKTEADVKCTLRYKIGTKYYYTSFGMREVTREYNERTCDIIKQANKDLITALEQGSKKTEAVINMAIDLYILDEMMKVQRTLLMKLDEDITDSIHDTDYVRSVLNDGGKQDD